jgi:hypothetical protein
MNKITKKQRKEMAREIIDSNEYDVPFDAIDLLEFSEVCGEEITYAVRKRLPEFPKNTRHVEMSVAGGPVESRSWLGMIDGWSPLAEVKKAMREHASKHMRDFMKASVPICAKCRSNADLTVDHMCIPFDTLANNFLSKYTTLPKLEKRGHVCEVFSDDCIRDDWLRFHNSQANYQILCRSCNASKGKKSC